MNNTWSWWLCCRLPQPKNKTGCPHIHQCATVYNFKVQTHFFRQDDFCGSSKRMTCNLYQRSGLYVPGRSTNKPQTCQRKTSKTNHGVDQCSHPVQCICHDSGSFEWFSTWNPIPDRGQIPVSFHHLAAGEASLHMVPKMVGYITPITMGVDMCRWWVRFGENSKFPPPSTQFGSLAGFFFGEVVPVTFPFLPLDIFRTGIEIIVNTSSGKVVLEQKTVAGGPAVGVGKA